MAHLHFRVAPALLFGVKKRAHIAFGHRVLLEVVLDKSLHQNRFTGAFNGAAHVAFTVKTLLFGFLHEHGLLGEKLLHLIFEFFRTLLTAGRGSLDHVFLFGLGDEVTVHTEGLSGGKSRCRRKGRSGGSKNQCFKFHFCVSE